MVDLHLDRSFTRHTYGAYKGMIVVEHWYSYDPQIRYRTVFSGAAWDTMTAATRETVGFDTLIKAGKALTECSTAKRESRVKKQQKGKQR